VVAGRSEEDLRFVLQAAERLAVDDAIAVALEGRADRVFGFWPDAALAVRAFRGLRSEDVALALF
jgi:hypothetical protein